MAKKAYSLIPVTFNHKKCSNTIKNIRKQCVESDHTRKQGSKVDNVLHTDKIRFFVD